MILRRCLRIAGYVHATLFFALMIPLVYAAADLADPAGAGILYLKCLLIAVPVIITERAVKRTKGLAAYLLICMILLGSILGIAGLTKPSGAYAVCYYIGMCTETSVIAFMRLQRRLKDSEKRRASEPFAAKESEFLDTPFPALMWYFVVVYIFGLCLDAKDLCDMAFYSAAVYLFLAVIYTYFRMTQSYLERNKRTKGISGNRLYGIGLMMLLIFCMLLFIGILPSVFMTNQRKYTDIRHWFDDVELVPYEYESDARFEESVSGGMGIMELLYDGEPVPEPSAFMNAVFWIIAGICIAALVYGILLAIIQIFKDFRGSHDENGDIIEEIKEKEKTVRQRAAEKMRGGADSAAQRIKRRYRKMIRKHRKDRPAPYESPAEIEEFAGLKEDEQMQQLHKEYEAVRYGNTEHL